MALLFCDGFGHVDDDFATLLKWDSVYQAASVEYGAGYGRTGGWGIRLLIAAHSMQKNLDNESTVIVGMALKVPELATEEQIQFMDGASSQVRIGWNADGSISAKRNTTVIGTSVPGVVLLDTWFYIEVKVVFSNTVGSVVIKVDGVQVLNITGQDTCTSANEYCNILKLCGTLSYTYIDDLYICDTTGTVNNDFLGDVSITTLYPTSDGNSSDFTPSTGVDNYALVDEAQLVGDTDHNESSTIGHKDLYGVTTFAETGDILGVQVTAAVKNTDAGTMNVRPLSRSGATPADNEGSDFTLSQTMKAAMHVFEKEPTDAVAWTAAKVNAAEFGLKVQS